MYRINRINVIKKKHSILRLKKASLLPSRVCRAVNRKTQGYPVRPYILITHWFPSSSWSCQCPCGCGTVVKRCIIIITTTCVLGDLTDTSAGTGTPTVIRTFCLGAIRRHYRKPWSLIPLKSQHVMRPLANPKVPLLRAVILCSNVLWLIWSYQHNSFISFIIKI